MYGFITHFHHFHFQSMRTEETSMETPRLSFLKDEEPYFCKEFLLSSVFDSMNKDLVKHKKAKRE